MLAFDKHINKVDSQLLAEYILFRGGAMSHLKLQKLLFYVDALHIAFFETPIIDDQFEAWVHGPVSRKIYNNIKDHSILYDNVRYVKNGDEPTPDVILQQQVTEEQLELINEVLDEYGKLSQYQLETLSHSELPWINARKGYSPADKCTVVIDKNLTMNFYKNQVYGQKD
jgi:uncharacterized phage-associated protein